MNLFPIPTQVQNTFIVKVNPDGSFALLFECFGDKYYLQIGNQIDLVSKEKAQELLTSPHE